MEGLNLERRNVTFNVSAFFKWDMLIHPVPLIIITVLCMQFPLILNHLPDCIVNITNALVKIHVASSQLLLLDFGVGSTVVVRVDWVMFESNIEELQVTLTNSSQEMFIGIHVSVSGEEDIVRHKY